MQERNLETALRMPITRDGIDTMNSELRPTTTNSLARLALKLIHADSCVLANNDGLKPSIVGDSNRRRLRWSGVVVTVLAGVGGACLSILFSVGIAHAGSGDLDCADFGTQQAAQRVLRENTYDVNRLDADGDGEACELNDNAIVWTGLGAALGGALGFGLTPATPGNSKGRKFPTGEVIGLGVIGAIIGGTIPGGVGPREWSGVTYGLVAGLVSAVALYAWITKQINESRAAA